MLPILLLNLGQLRAGFPAKALESGVGTGFPGQVRYDSINAPVEFLHVEPRMEKDECLQKDHSQTQAR